MKLIVSYKSNESHSYGLMLSADEQEVGCHLLFYHYGYGRRVCLDHYLLHILNPLG